MEESNIKGKWAKMFSLATLPIKNAATGASIHG